MSNARNQVIPPKSGTAFVVKQGETLRVTDLEGRQVSDFVCFNEHDPSEFFSAGKTRVNVFRVRISSGDRLYSNKNTAMFTIGEDTVGVHDLLFPPCNRWIYEQVLGQPGTTRDAWRTCATPWRPMVSRKARFPIPLTSS